MNQTQRVYRDRLYENWGLPALVNLLDSNHRRLLDVGCGDGANMRLLAARGHEVVGITISEAEAQVVRAHGLPCHVLDIAECSPPFLAQSFDAPLFSHVLEHLACPDVVLGRYLELLRPGGAVYVALPNALHLNQRWQFALGRFRYTDIGLVDRTHLRFFDFATARQLLGEVGLDIVGHLGVGQCPMGPLRRWAPALARWVDRWTSKRWPGLFAFHIIVVGRLPLFS